MILEEICARKRQEVERHKASAPLVGLREQVLEASAPRSFLAAVRKPGISLIAEIKRASPSKGVFLEYADAVELAAVYESAGARAISVLTDEPFFRGTLDDLRVVRANVALPCLRKDFVIDEYQIYEARAAQADAVLLIVRILSDQQLKDYLELTTQLRMTALVETHNADEIHRAIKAGAHVIGINNRDLDTFEVDINTTLELKKMVPGGLALVSESGIHSRRDVKMLEGGGVDAILVGEALVTSNDIGGKIRELLGSSDG
jgi:indole-3-glycerol phosphate synthase